MRYFKRVNEFGDITTVESYSHEADVPEAIEISEEEFNDFINSLPASTVNPGRDIPGEIDSILQRLASAGIP